jgi:uncharacterized membrane protein YcaP (DUF421 family)
MENGFDLYRTLLGGPETATLVFYFEIILRTAVMYLYTILLARVVGHDAIGQLGPFEFVLVIAVGSAAGDPMLYPDVGLLQGIAVITVVMLLHRGTGYATARWRKVEKVVQGGPVQVVRDGVVVEDAIHGGLLTRGELMAQLRLQGVVDTGEVETAYLETNGRVSVFPRAPGQRRAVEPTLPGPAAGG